MVQSSGCGKSRLLLELGSDAVTVTVLYLCLRRSTDSTGYPTASSATTIILSLLETEASATRFVKAIIAELASGSVPMQGSTPVALLNQDAFWTGVAQKATTSSPASPASLGPNVTPVFDFISFRFLFAYFFTS